MGFEGPSIYIGAAVGSWLQRRFSRVFARTDTKVLLVCGAAAGVAAIFKAPATGMVFALEVPYRQDLARRMLLPAMFASAASYVVFAAINGTTPLFPVSGAPPFDLRDLGGAETTGRPGFVVPALIAAASSPTPMCAGHSSKPWPRWKRPASIGSPSSTTTHSSASSRPARSSSSMRSSSARRSEGCQLRTSTSGRPRSPARSDRSPQRRRGSQWPPARRRRPTHGIDRSGRRPDDHRRWTIA